jgi:hypothetical protein
MQEARDRFVRDREGLGGFFLFLEVMLFQESAVTPQSSSFSLEGVNYASVGRSFTIQKLGVSE